MNLIISNSRINYLLLLKIAKSNQKIYQNYENGKTLLVAVYDRFNILGDIEYFLKQDADCSVQALSDVRAIQVSYSEVDKLYKLNAYC